MQIVLRRNSFFAIKSVYLMLMYDSISSSSEDISEIFSQVFDWLSRNLATILQVTLILIVAVIASRIGGHIFSRLLARTVREDMFPSKTDRDRRLKTLNNICTAIISFILWSVAVIMILNKLGINTAPLLASAGILGLALGFGAQSLVKDFITGMFIIAENQYRVGDYVEIQNIKGTVRSITMRTTIIKDDNGSIFSIPNGSIIVTGNHTMNNNNVSIELSVAADTNVEKLITIINDAGKSLAKSVKIGEFITDPLHFKQVKDVSGGALVVRITGKVAAGKQAEVKSAYFMIIQKEFVKHKISLK